MLNRASNFKLGPLRLKWTKCTQLAQPSSEDLRIGEEYYRTAIQIDPNHVEAHARLAALLQRFQKGLSGAEALPSSHQN
jgi:hypothetical protein